MFSDLKDVIKSIQVGYDLTLEMNEFNEPRLKSEIETIKDVLLFILFTKQGQYPSLPNIGYDIENKLYSFYDEINENDIMEDICSQCSALRNYFNNGSIIIKKYKYKNQPSLIISISGTENYPDSYMKDSVDIANRYMIGITFDELNQMICDVKRQKD